MSAEGSGPLLRPPGDEWRVLEGDGFRILRDRRGDTTVAFAESVARGLEDQPRWLDCRWLYDARGSELYERITEQPEYYPTRTEAAILERHAGRIRRLAGDTTLVELGSGSSRKTRLVLDAWLAEGPTRYVPIDISAAALERACRGLAESLDGLTVEGVAASYGRGLELAAEASPLTLLFLGSTVGNLNNDELDRFLEMLAGYLAPGDRFLLGVDLVKDPRVLEAAYNDAAGWTARFTRNLFTRMNRELDAGIPLDSVEHVAFYNDRLERIEIHARFTDEVRVELPVIDESYRIAPGEMVLVEISRKFRPREVAANVARFGFGTEEVFTDDQELFGLLLLARRRDVPVAENRRRLLETRLQERRGRTLGLVQPLQPLLDVDAAWSRRIVAEVAAIARSEAGLLSDEATERCPVCGKGSGAVGEDRDGSARGSGDGEDPGPEGRSWAATLERLHDVRRRTLERLRTGRTGAEEILREDRYRRLLEHEGLHQERILEAVQGRADLVYQLAGREPPPPRPDRLAAARRVRIPAGILIRRGEPGKDRRNVTVGDFWIGAAPVTNGRFVAFLEAGGYEESGWWCAAGWRWRQREEVRCPAHWLREGGEWQVRVFGERRRMDPARPVMHVSWWEADAFARWDGGRLPGPDEWDKAAGWNPSRRVWQRYPWGDRAPDAQLANLGARLDEPAPVGSYPRGRSFYGCHQMLGDVWEWTEPGEVGDGRRGDDRREADGSDGTRGDDHGSAGGGEGPDGDRRDPGGAEEDAVAPMRGGSWATPSGGAGVEIRRVATRGTRTPFVGFRCAYDTLEG